MINDPKILILAFIVGTIPSLFWLWFWLKEDDEKEPKKVLIASFILGMFSVIFVIPVQKFIKSFINDPNIQLVLWATVEEIMKYMAVMVVIGRTKYVNKPIDWAIYLITSALGFAALENTMFLLEPFSAGQNIVGILTGGLRFLGSTLLHSITSAIVGISLGLSFYMSNFIKKYYLITGLFIATLLHTLFNFFIMKNVGSNFIKIFALLWVVTIIIMLLFEKLRRLSGEN